MYIYEFGQDTYNESYGIFLTHKERYLPEQYRAICNGVYERINNKADTATYWHVAIEEMLKLGFKRIKPECKFVVNGEEPFKPVKI